MLRILKKCPIKLGDLQSSKEIISFGISTRYLRTVLEFDGSLTKFVMNLSPGANKPLIKIIEEKTIQISHMKSLEGSTDTLVQLQTIFSPIKQDKIDLIERSISFNLVNQKQPQKENLLYFARSFWDTRKYNQIMQKDKHKPIGLNLIDQKVEIFRQLNWTGISDLEISHKKQGKQSITTYTNLISRSYTMLNQNRALCQLEQFFLPQMFDIFTIQ